MNSPITLTVSQLNEYIGAIIDSAELLSNIYIKGEISNFTNHYKSGHFYFTLKDEKSNLRAVMFRSFASGVKFIPENGMKITARGRISVFERDGIYQLYCEELIPDGVGALYVAYEQLKEKLSDEGLFSQEHKKSIPKFPQKIGIITSVTGAAIADLENILTRRYPCCDVFLYNALVQGNDAPKSLISGLEFFDTKVDTIIIGRGGGSIEDLWCFNDESLARKIFACKTPVISAVGHEIDFTICDFVSDLRAPTPSAAAELAVPDIKEIKNLLASIYTRMGSSIKNEISLKREKISSISNLSVFKKSDAYIDKKRTELLILEEAINKNIVNIHTAKKNSLKILCTKVEALSPLAVLTRGYGAVYDVAGNVVTSTNQISLGSEITLQMSDGKVKSLVTEIT